MVEQLLREIGYHSIEELENKVQNMAVSGEPSSPTQQPPVTGRPLGRGIRLEASKPAVVRNPYSLEDTPEYAIETFKVTGKPDSTYGSSKSDPTLVNTVSASSLEDAKRHDASLIGLVDPAIQPTDSGQGSAKLTGTKDQFGHNMGQYPDKLAFDEDGPAGSNSTSS